MSIKHLSKNKEFTIVTSSLNRTANEIAVLYKERWVIELLFKRLKQNLEIKKFLGESKNAISIQIYVAIISYILLSLFKKGVIRITRLKDMIIVKSSLFLNKAPELVSNKISEIQNILKNKNIITDKLKNSEFAHKLFNNIEESRREHLFKEISGLDIIQV